jgi:hypothetical protein
MRASTIDSGAVDAQRLPFGRRTDANHSTLIRSFLIDSDPRTPFLGLPCEKKF